MLKNQRGFDNFVKYSSLYQGFIDVFEEDIGDITINEISEKTSYCYNFHRDWNDIRIKNITNEAEKYKELEFEIDFSNLKKFFRMRYLRYMWRNNPECDDELIKTPEIVRKLIWLQEHNKPEYKKKLLQGKKRISPFSSIKITISSLDSMDAKWLKDHIQKIGSEIYVNWENLKCNREIFCLRAVILGEFIYIDINEPDSGKKLYDFFKRRILSIDLVSE